MAARDIGRTGMCVVHHDRPAVTRCATCHRPICEACVVSTADGKFCSRECAARAADFRASKGKFAPRSGFSVASILKLVVGIVILIAALAAINRWVYRLPVAGGVLDRVPIIGQSGPSATQLKRSADDVLNESGRRLPK